MIDGVSLSAVEGTNESEFLSGVIEGFYGKPWTPAERIELFGWMARWGLNTYFYAPKDDLHHRALWREPYSAEDAGELAHLVETCRQRNIHFVYALSPGLDIRYRDQAELDRLYARFEQMLAVGCKHFSLLFDDIPDRLELQDIARWGSLASAQCHVANAVFTWTLGVEGRTGGPLYLLSDRVLRQHGQAQPWRGRLSRDHWPRVVVRD